MSNQALVIRLGAYGDMVMVTPLLKRLKEDGYRVTLSCHARSKQIVLHDPHIDEFHIHDQSVTNDALDGYWEDLGRGFDKVINLSESIEKGLLALQDTDDYKLPKEERHARFNVNYYERTMALGGYAHPAETVGAPELHFTAAEEAWVREVRKKLLGKFKILWALSGSAFHKVYPYAEYAAVAFLNKHRDACIITVGDDMTKLLEWKHPGTWNRSGEWSIRKVMLMARYADLVVSPETGVANFAGCFDTPKIILLSHSSKENLTKHWRNCVSIEPEVACYPCHQLHYTMDSCPPDVRLGSPCCMASIHPDRLVGEMEVVYELDSRRRREAVPCA